MFRCDILVTRENDDANWTMRSITRKGDLAMIAEVGLLSSERDGLDRLKFSNLSPELVYNILHGISEEIQCEMVTMPDAVAELNARSLRITAAQKELGLALNAYFTPRLDAAIEIEDRVTIVQIVTDFPAGVEKSFIVDRIRQRFPVLKEPGMDLAKWAREKQESN